MIYPLAAMALLALVLAFNLLLTRIRMVKSGEIREEYFALMQGEATEKELKASNAFRNQFQMPVLFYTAGLLCIVYSQETAFLVTVAWLYVLARIVHALIHTTTNHVMQRLAAFLVSNAMLVVLWVGLLLQIR